jgi:hypothetical protein
VRVVELHDRGEKSVLRFQAGISACVLAGCAWLVFARPPAYPLSGTDVLGLAAIMALAAWSVAWSVRRLSAREYEEPVAVIDEQRGVWSRGSGYGYVGWNEILGGRVKYFWHRGSAGYLLDIEVPEEVGQRCLKQAPLGWRPIAQWKSERGYYLRVASSLPRAELEDELKLILQWKLLG